MSIVTLTFWPLTYKINRAHPLTIANMSAKFDQEAHNGLVLYRVHKLISIYVHCDLDLWPLTFKINRGPILSPWLTCLPSLIKKYTMVPKAQVSYCHSAPSVRSSVVVRKLFTFSTSSTEPLDVIWWNLIEMKYPWFLTSVVVFGQIRTGADPGWGKNRSLGVPFFKKLLLQTGRLQRQTECIAMI